MKTLFKDAVIVPMTGEKEYSCLGMENGKICWLGREEPKEHYDKVISLGGKYIYPGLTDSHIHLLYSIVLSACSFNICTVQGEKVTPDSLSGIAEAIKAYALKNPGSGLIMINQYIPSGIREDCLPTAQELDAWTKGRETVIFTMDGHSCSLSTSLSKKLGILTETGILQGTEYDMIQGKITNYAASKVNLKVLAKGVAEFENQCFRYGITKVCALDGDDTAGAKSDPLLALLILLARRMDLQVRLYPEYMNYDILHRIGPKQRKLRIGGCAKWELDGSVGSHSAAFEHPFKDTGTIGHKYYDDTTITGKVQEALKKGIQLTCHAIGTCAIDQITAAYWKNEKLIPSNGPMPRIDHFEFPSRSAVEFVKSHRLAVTVQPGYAYADKRCLHTYERFLDAQDLRRIVPLKELADAGTIVLGSTDSPVQSVNPYEQMRGMMDYYDPSQSLSTQQALESYTVNAAKALDEPEGTLFTGGPATFFISASDILHMTADEMLQVTADEVYINGKRMHSKNGTVPELLRMLLRQPHKI